MNEKWNKRFLELADQVASWSKDPSTKVGCVVVNNDKIVVSVGYNGFPRGVQDSEDRYNDRSLKYLLVQHAEANAISSAREPLDGFTAFVTHYPYSNCMGLLIQSGIKTVVTTAPSPALQERFADSFRAAQLMCDEAGIELIIMDR